MTVNAAALMKAREGIMELRENIGAWTSEPVLSRALIAQCELVDRFLAEGEYDQAHGAIQGVIAAYRAAGPGAFEVGL